MAERTGQDTQQEQPKKSSLLGRLRGQYRWFDHLMRMQESFGNHYGNHYAAAITYFSVLSIVPILMVAFSVVGFIVAGNQHVLDQIQSGITGSVPEGLNDVVAKVVAGALHARGGVGIIGLVLALYSGVGWMKNLRDALTAQWGMEKQQQSLVKRTWWDLVSLIGLGLALVVSFALTAAGSGVGEYLLGLVGLQDQAWARAALVVATVVLALIANWLVFLWVFSRLPRERVSVRSALKGAVVAAIGFEILKQAGSYYLASVSGSASFAVFGPILGLLIFANLVARFLLYVTAWTATAKENVTPKPVPAPAPAVIRPHVRLGRAPGAGQAVGLLGVGALVTVLLRGTRKRR